MNHSEFDLLQFFAEDAGGTGAAPAAGGTEGTTGADQNTAEKQENEAVSPAAAGQDVYAEFDALVGKGGKYADAYAKKLQSSFDKRYKEFKAAEDKALRLSQFRDTVAGDYAGVNPDDIDALEEAYLKDQRRFAQRAVETGESAEKLANDDYMSRKLKQYEEREKREKASKAKQDEAQRFYNALAKQEQEMAKKYEGFNLEKELRNDRFKAMLKANVPMEDAYFAAHRSEMLKKTVAEVKNATLQSVAAKGTRPAETASSASAPTTAQVDYSKLSRRDFMKIWNS